MIKQSCYCTNIMLECWPSNCSYIIILNQITTKFTTMLLKGNEDAITHKKVKIKLQKCIILVCYETAQIKKDFDVFYK